MKELINLAKTVYDYTGKKIRPTAQSPINRAVSLMVPGNVTEVPMDEVVANLQNTADATLIGIDSGVGDIVEDYAKHLVGKMSTRLPFLQNVVAVKSGQFASIVTDKADFIMDEVNDFAYTVETFGLDDIFNFDELRPWIEDCININGNNTLSCIPMAKWLPDLSETELRDLITSGVPTWDKLLTDMLVTKSSAYVTEIYNRVLRTTANERLGTNGGPAVKEIISSKYSADDLLISFLIMEALYNDKCQKFNDVNSVSAYETKTLSGRCLTTVAFSLKKKIDAIEYVIGEQRIFRMINHDTKVINVYDEVYRDFIMNGGNNEALTVVAMLDKMNMTMGREFNPLVLKTNDILTNLKSYEERYRKDSLDYSLKGREAKYDELRNFIKVTFIELIQQELPIELEILPESINAIIQTFDSKVNELTNDDIDTILADKMIEFYCTSVWPLSTFHKFMATMNNYRNQNPEMDVRTAAYHAVLEEVVDFLMLDTEKLNA